MLRARDPAVIRRRLRHRFARRPAIYSRARISPHPEVLVSLPPREQGVFRLVALGHTNQEIAVKLCISEKTVETRRTHVYSKLGLRSRAELVRLALEHGLLSPRPREVPGFPRCAVSCGRRRVVQWPPARNEGGLFRRDRLRFADLRRFKP